MTQSSLDIVMKARDEASAALKHVEREIGGLSGVMKTATGTALGFGGAMAALAGLGALGSVIQGTVGRMISLNAETETMGKSFRILMSDAAAEAGAVSDAQDQVSSAVTGAAETVRDAQERMADAAADHQYALAQLSGEFDRLGTDAAAALGKLQTEFTAALNEMGYSHARTMENLRQQLSDYSATFAQQSSERRRRFEDEIATITRRYQDLARTAPDRFLRERDAAKKNAEDLQAAIAEEEAKGTDADKELLASLRQRLIQEQGLQNMTFAQFKAMEKKKEVEEKQAAQARYDHEEGLARASYERQVAALQQRLGQEEAEFARAMAKRQEKYDEDVAAARAAESEKRAALEERQAAEEKSYARSMRDIEQTLERATRGYGAAISKGASTAGASVNQLKAMYADLAVATGMATDTEIQRADAMVEYIKRQAAAMPISRREVQAAVRDLLAYQINAVQYLETIGNVAAGMSVPMKQVTGAFGALATGQIGEAVMRFREFGINLKAISGLKFDAQGSLVTPVAEAMELIKANLDERFKGMMSGQMSGWTGMVSNLEDAWDAFTERLGVPVFAEAKKGLAEILKYLDENGEAVAAFAKDAGEGIAGMLRELGPLAGQAMSGLFEWVGSGRAGRDIKEAAAAGAGIVRFVLDLVRFTGDVKGVVDAFGDWLDQQYWIKAALGAVLVAVGLLALFLGGPLLIVLGVLAAGFALLVGGIDQGMLDVIGFFEAMATAVENQWKGLMKGIGKQWDALVLYARDSANSMIDLLNAWIGAWNSIKISVPEIELPLGGRVGGWEVGMPQIPSIPKLGKGGIAMAPTLAVVGDRKEAIIPLDRLGAAGGTTVIVYVQGSVTTERDLARRIREELTRTNQRTVTGGLFA